MVEERWLEIRTYVKRIEARNVEEDFCMPRIESRVSLQIGSLKQSEMLRRAQDVVQIHKCDEQMKDVAEHADE